MASVSLTDKLCNSLQIVIMLLTDKLFAILHPDTYAMMYTVFDEIECNQQVNRDANIFLDVLTNRSTVD